MTPKKKGNGRRTPKATRREKDYQEFREEVLLPLFSMFAMADDVFTEQDAFDETKRKIGYGRLYEEWKRCRAKLDPEFSPAAHERPQRFVPKLIQAERREVAKKKARAKKKKQSSTKSGKSRRATTS